MTHLEKIARAIAGAEWDGIVNRDMVGPRDKWANNEWRSYLPEARAAVEAMREPSEAMLDAVRTPGIPGRRLEDAENKQFYRAMIDAILNEKG